MISKVEETTQRSCWFGSALLGLTALLIAINRFIPLYKWLEPNGDEAGFIANLPVADMVDFLEPLPLFEQTAPLGYLVLTSFFAHLFQNAETLVSALRAISVTASLASLLLIYFVIRRRANWETICLVLCLYGLTPFAISYSLEIKPYIFDQLAMSVILFAGVHVAFEQSKSSMILFFLGGLFAIFFSFMAPISIAAISIGVIAHRLLQVDHLITLHFLTRFSSIILVLIIVFAVYYLGYTRPVTEYQMAGYAHVYEPKLLSFPPDRNWLRLPTLLADQMWMAGPHGRIWTALFAIIFLSGALAIPRSFRIVPVTFLVAIILIYGLSLAGMLPIAYTRHFSFMYPIVSIICGYGIYTLISKAVLALPLNRSICVVFSFCALLILAVGVVGVHRSGNSQLTVSDLISEIQSDEDANRPVWVYFGAQTRMRVLGPVDMQQIGLVSHASQVPGWVWQLRNYPHQESSASYIEEFRLAIQDNGPLWLMFAGYHGELNGLELFREIAEQQLGDCEVYNERDGLALWKCG